MSKTTKTNAVGGAKQARTVSGARSSATAPADRNAVSRLAAAVRKRLGGAEPSSAQRAVLSELDRYERAIERWASVVPSEGQCAAMLGQLLDLDERAQRLPQAKVKTRSTRPPRLATTTKLAKASARATQKLPRAEP